MSEGNATLTSVRFFYAPALIAAIAGNVWIAIYDMKSLLSLVPLSVTLIAPIAVMTIRRHRSVVVVAAVLFQFAFTILGGFTIGDAYLPSAFLLVAGGVAEWIVHIRRTAR